METDAGAERAAAVVVAAGPWTAQLLPELAPLLTVTRQVQAWFAPPRAPTPPPCRAGCATADRRRAVYGLAPDPAPAPSPGDIRRSGSTGRTKSSSPTSGRVRSTRPTSRAFARRAGSARRVWTATRSMPRPASTRCRRTATSWSARAAAAGARISRQASRATGSSSLPRSATHSWTWRLRAARNCRSASCRHTDSGRFERPARTTVTVSHNTVIATVRSGPSWEDSRTQFPEPARPSMRGKTPGAALSARALATPEPFVRLFARRVQQEGALDLTQGDYKNADFAPHPEVVRAAQRITRNTVHSYGPAVGRMDVRSEVAEFFNRDGLLDYPDSEVRFLPDEVLFTPGTRAGSPSCSRSSARTARASSCRDRAGSTTGSSSAPARRSSSCRRRHPNSFPTRELDRLLAKGGISSVITQQPAQPDGTRLPARPRRGTGARCSEAPLLRALRLRLPAARLRRLVRQSCVRQPRVARLGGLAVRPVEDGHVRRLDGCARLLARHLRPDPRRTASGPARSSRTCPPGWSRRRPRWPRTGRSPRCRVRSRRSAGRRRTCASDATSCCAQRTRLAPLGVERTDFGGTFYSPLAFPGLVGEPFDRLRNGVHETGGRAELGRRLRVPALRRRGRHPVRRVRGRRRRADRFGTWQRLSYGSKDVKELAVFMDRVRARIEKQGRLGSGGAVVAETPLVAGRRVGEHLHGPAGTTPSTGWTRGVRGGAAALPRESASRGPAPDRHQASGLDRASRRAARAGPARSAGRRAGPRAPRADAPRVEPAHGGETRIRGVDRRPAGARAARCCSTSRAGRSAPTGSTFPRRSCSRCSGTAWCRARTGTCCCASRTRSSSRTRRKSRRSSPRSRARTSSFTLPASGSTSSRSRTRSARSPSRR